MVHESCKEAKGRYSALSAPEKHTRVPKSTSKEQEDAVCGYTPQITVRGIQKGFERGTENVFHRLHHGPLEVAVYPDPDVNKDAAEEMLHVTSRLMKSRRPIGVSKESWRKVTETQTIACQEMLEKRKREQHERDLELKTSPTLSQGGYGYASSLPGSTPGGYGGADIFSPRNETGQPNLDMMNSALMRGSHPSSRSGASSQATRTPGSQATPGGFATPGGLEAATGFPPKPSKSPGFSPASSAFPMGSPEDAPEEEDQPTQVVLGTDHVIMMLEHCEEIVSMKNANPVTNELDSTW